MQEIPAISARRLALKSRFPEWPGWTLAQAFDAAADRHPDRSLFTSESGTKSYAQLKLWSRRIARGMIACGIQPGDHIALLMANYVEFVAVKLAIARVGAVTIPVNFNLRGEELRYVLDQSDAVMLIAMSDFRGHDYIGDLDRFAPGWRAGVDPALPSLRAVFILPTGGTAPPDLQTVADLAARGDAAADDEELCRRETLHDPHAICDILYTSGTTGLPKGVMLTHDMVLRAAYASVYHRAFEDGRTIVHALPMYHVFGYVECLVGAWFVGGHIVSQLAFEPAGFLDLAERHCASDLVLLPNMTLKLLDLIETRGFAADNLVAVFNSGGVNPPTIWRDIRTHLRPSEIHTAYGMSETTASTVCTLPDGDDDWLVESNGHYKLAHVAGDPAIGGLTAIYKVVDPETDIEMPPGEIGELLVRGPIVTRGYYRKPDETVAAFSDGWLRTGDLGRVTAEGYLTLTGRLKESYRCGGEMVMPREIEALFDDHPDVALALAVGIPDVRMGDIGCLCIVPRDGRRPDPQSLLDHCAARLARFKVPRHVLMFAADNIPMTSTGRPQKIKLSRIAAERLSGNTAPALQAAHR